MACNRINNLNSTIYILLHYQNLGKMYYFLYITHTIHNSTYMFQASSDNYTESNLLFTIVLTLGHNLFVASLAVLHEDGL